MKKITFLLIIILIAPKAYNQVTRHVPGKYHTIQQAIDAANNLDTILVQPGTYVENLVIDGKGIVLASLFILDQDSSYISQTIIDGNENGSVIESANDWIYTSYITGFTITNGRAEQGGGICCYDSSPMLCDLIISENIAVPNGYGAWGGGLYCRDSNPIVKNVRLSHNSSSQGGGVFCWGANPQLENVLITNNTASEGGGIYIWSSSLQLKGVTLSYNSSTKGGGLYIFDYYGEVEFDSIDRCNVYKNYAIQGNDFYNRSIENIQQIRLDTFTVLYPSSFYAQPLQSFDIDILNYLVEQLDEDLYVSPGGSNDNSGLSAEDPLRNILHAFSIIRADSNTTNSVHLLEGTFSPSSSNEVFPVSLIDYINLIGSSKTDVILDAEKTGNVLIIEDVRSNAISNITIKGGNALYPSDDGGGIYILHSNTELENLIILDNEALNGGGIFMARSFVSIENIEIRQNSANYGGGIYLYDSDPTMTNITIIENYASEGYGLFCSSAKPRLTNVTLSDNYGSGCGALYCNYSSHPILTNCICYGWLFDQNICLLGYYGEDSITISYSDIQGGIEIIVGGVVNWLDGNIDEDPLFEFGTYELPSNSPCIDSGDPDTSKLNLPYYDLIGNLRLWDGDEDGDTIVDMGAYEFGSIGVGTEEFKVQCSRFNVKVYPNPATSVLNADLGMDEPGRIQVQVVNHMGQVVMSFDEGDPPTDNCHLTFDVSGLPSGLYFLHITSSNTATTDKFIKY